jgi:ATP-binding cassette subfamily B protein
VVEVASTLYFCLFEKVYKTIDEEKVIDIFKKILKYTKWIVKQTSSSFPSLVLYTVISILSSLTSVLVALSSKKLFDSAQFGNTNSMLQSGLYIIIIVLLETIILTFLAIYGTKISASLSNKLQKQLFDKLLKMQWLDFTKYHSGDLLTRMTSDVDTVTSGISSVIPRIISLFFGLSASLVVLIIFDPILALCAFALGPISIVFTRLFSNKLKDYHLRIQETESDYRSFIQERMKNMHILKTFRLEKISTDILSYYQNKKLGWIMKRSKLNAASASILSLGYWVGFLLAVLWGSTKLSHGEATFGTVTLFLQLVGQIQDPFVGLAYSIPQIIIMYASAGRLMALHNLESENFTEESIHWEAAGIYSHDLEFSYDKDAPVLTNINFKIKPGEFVAVVGASGEGKTTFIRLLLSLLKPTNGDLAFFNPETQEKIKADVITRSLSSYVPQGNTLFSGTIEENTLLGNKSASRDDLVEALKKACIWDFIDSLPDKLETKIGENGYGLSEGQAQRISIARALLAKKPILILDEATSALDSETELELLKSISSIDPSPTSIIITHRMAALNYCNRILSIENKTIKEVVNPEEILPQNLSI